MSKTIRRPLTFIGCEIVRREEACALAARSPHGVDLRFRDERVLDST